MASSIGKYNEDTIKTLDWKEHIRLRPGMYIGKLGDGQSPDDGMYILLKEVMDNVIDEHTMGFGYHVEVTIEGNTVCVRDYGRGIPLGKVVDAVSKINTSGKFDSTTFQKAVGLNGIGMKAVNALSSFFSITCFREGKSKTAVFERGILKEAGPSKKTNEKNGTIISFEPDALVFGNYLFNHEHIEQLLVNYTYLNTKLTIVCNGKKFKSQHGLLDLLTKELEINKLAYPIVHIKGKDIDIAFSHGPNYGENIFSFVNGQHTTQGGTHTQAFRETYVKTVRQFFKKQYDVSDIRQGIVAAVAIRIQEPIFESQTKTKLGSTHTSPGGRETIRSFVSSFLEKELDNYLHRNTKMATALRKHIEASEHERKQLSSIKKLANERAKKANLHNKKLRDCTYHYTDTPKGKNKMEAIRLCKETTIFVTEGDSASGSITKVRNTKTQAVFSLRGKPLNTFGLPQKIVYQNEEFNLLQHALNIENGISHLRYARIVIATDADVDGMHIRLLIITFFLQFFPELIKQGHVYILETPLFRVRNKQKTVYCYSIKEKEEQVVALEGKPEVTRFKGLGEISPEEFGQFIGVKMRVEPVRIPFDMQLPKLLSYYMGDNSQERQKFIIDNLYVEMEAAE